MKLDKQQAQDMQEFLKARDQSRMKRINNAFSLPRVKKWQAIIDLYLDESPGLQEAVKEVLKTVKEQREMIGVWNPKAVSSKHSDMRLGLMLPSAYMAIIETCDPEFREVMAEGAAGQNRAEQAKMMKMLRKAFPQFVVPQI